jgi:hypothetical protein
MAGQRIGSALVTREGHIAGVLMVTDVCDAFGEYVKALHSDDGGDEAA